MPCNDRLGYHEVLDRTSVLHDTWDTNICEHMVLEEQPKLKKMADEIAEKMADFYQACYVATSTKFKKEKL